MHESDDFAIGSRTFAPGEKFASHYHELCEEIFIGIRGEIVIELRNPAGKAFTLVAGDKLAVRRGTVHALANRSGHICEIAYLKVPFISDDVIWLGAT
jgi:quercetin dioxygenase-like cupin family protein